ncbi:SpoIIE family protein phosphatase [Streptomyces griseoluteus]|uniref:ATP-binding SpoIIE family protein phosphatase n=1 Tax=Streptomyces griseoluteus TaxID=29306 RepID=UPI0037F4CBD2
MRPDDDAHTSNDGSYPLFPEQEALLSEAFRQILSDCGADVAVLYAGTQSNSTSLTAMAVGGAPPLIFSIPEKISCAGPRASAVAYRTETTVVMDVALPLQGEEHLLDFMPYPRLAIAVPLFFQSKIFGVLTGIWIPPNEPAETASVTRAMELLGKNTARRLTDSGIVSRMTAHAPMVLPSFVNRLEQSSLSPLPAPRWGAPSIPGSAALSQMYQVHRFAAELNRAPGVEDVMEALRDRVMSPMGAEDCTAVVSVDGRLLVVGFNGSAELARMLHSAPVNNYPWLMDLLVTGRSVFLSDREATDAVFPVLGEVGLEACAVLPLIGSGAFRGVLVLGFRQARIIDSDEQALLMMMAAHLAVAIERCRLNEAEHALAAALQRKLLPPALPDLPEALLTARYVSAASPAGMGGDWYDVIPLPDNRTALVIGDVQGHDIDSTVVMGQIRSGIRAYATEGHAPTDVLVRSSALLSELDTDLYVTCCFARLDPEGELLDVALAGHPTPLLRCPEGSIVEVGAPANLPLGISSEYAYRGIEVPIRPGTLIMLYTDGVAAGSGDADAVSAARNLLRSARDVNSESIHKVANVMVANFSQHPRLRADDMALLLARYEGSPLGSARRVDRMALQSHDVQGVRAARNFVRDYLIERGLPGLVEDVEIMASEIVTNALIHAGTDVEISVRDYQDRIHFEARDTGVKPPIPMPITTSDEANATAEHGRGLSIVDVLSSAWGTSPHGKGKAVWFDAPKP